MNAIATAPEFRTVRSEAEFDALASEWDRLVLALDRPTPFLLHGWCAEWLSRNPGSARLAVEIAVSDGRLLAALPFVSERWGAAFTVGRFIGGAGSVFGDALVAPDAPSWIVAALVDRASAGAIDFASLRNLPEGSNLATVAGSERLWLQRHQRTARWHLEGDWEQAYRARTSSRVRNLHHRRQRQLAGLGRMEMRVARSPNELEDALEDAFRLHALRWRGRPDRSGFGTEAGKTFHRSLIRRLAPSGVPRITTLSIDGRPIAFLYALLVRDAMFVFRLAFDPAFGKFSPGLITNLAAIEDAARDATAVVDFLPGEERYKLELANDIQHVYMAFGLPRGVRGRAGMSLAAGSRRARSRLREVGVVQRAHTTLVKLRNRPRGG
jgi:CelD/BcsL family acetyltransferase involved in cellulose biosynthesis